MDNQSFKHSFPRKLYNALLVRDLSLNIISRNNKDRDFSKSVLLLYLPWKHYRTEHFPASCWQTQQAPWIRLDNSLNFSHSAKKDLVMATVELN